VKRTTGWLTLTILVLALGSLAVAGSKSTAPNPGQHPEVPQSVQKNTKDYNKQLAKSQKHNDKAAKRDNKAWKKTHENAANITH
jgi:hypothetical protein